jgi:hypothetical protein
MHRNPLDALTVQQLNRAILIKKKIVALEQELEGLSQATPATPAKVKRAKLARRHGRKRPMSPAARAKIAAGQKAAWARRKSAAAARNVA